MDDLELQLISLEFQWREADDLEKNARAQLAFNPKLPATVVAGLHERMERGKRMKESLMKNINALEAELDSAASG